MNAPCYSHYYIICGRVFDPSKKNFGARVIEVKDARFTSVTPLVEFPRRDAGVEVFDLLHYTLLPALVDGRVDVSRDSSRPAGRVTNRGGETETEYEVVHRSLQAAHLAGIGLVRDMGDAGLGDAIPGRDEKSQEALPKLLACRGGGYQETGSGGNVFGEEGVAQVVDRMVDDPRVDLIQVDVTNGCSLEELRVAVHVAHEHGKAVVAECRDDSAARAAVTAGIDFIDYGYMMSIETMDLLGEKCLVWTPAMASLRARLKHVASHRIHAVAESNARTILDHQLRMLQYAHSNGVRIMAGSDAGCPGVPHGGGLIRELEIMQEAGMPADELLAMATTRAAGWLGQDTRIAPGMPANFIAIKGSVRRRVSDLTRIEWVARKGKVRQAKTSPVKSDYPIQFRGLVSPGTKSRKTVVR